MNTKHLRLTAGAIMIAIAGNANAEQCTNNHIAAMAAAVTMCGSDYSCFERANERAQREFDRCFERTTGTSGSTSYGGNTALGPLDDFLNSQTRQLSRELEREKERQAAEAWRAEERRSARNREEARRKEQQRQAERRAYEQRQANLKAASGSSAQRRQNSGQAASSKPKPPKWKSEQCKFNHRSVYRAGGFGSENHRFYHVEVTNNCRYRKMICTVESNALTFDPNYRSSTYSGSPTSTTKNRDTLMLNPGQSRQTEGLGPLMANAKGNATINCKGNGGVG